MYIWQEHQGSTCMFDKYTKEVHVHVYLASTPSSYRFMLSMYTMEVHDYLASRPRRDMCSVSQVLQGGTCMWQVPQGGTCMFGKYVHQEDCVCLASTSRTYMHIWQLFKDVQCTMSKVFNF